MQLLGTWSDYKRPDWEENLENISESIVKQTGLSRIKLKQVLDVLYENGVVK